MQNVLWLASWYPNKFDRLNGDFIQRHAIAVAPFCNLTVITLQFVPADWQEAVVETTHSNQNNFKEINIYLKSSTLPSPFNKVVDQYRYMWAFKSEVRRHLYVSIPQLVHVHVPIKAGIIGLWLKKKLNIPMVVTEHWGIYNDFAPDKYSKRSVWFKKLTTKVITEADTFLPVSKNLGESINRLIIKKPFEVIKNVVDTQLFYYQPVGHKPFFWISHVSMMNHPKNPKGILKAFSEAVKENKLLRLRMIGKVSDEIISYSKELNINEFVVFTGLINQQEVASLLQQSDAFLLFSFYENMPCVIAEALCCGLPVISTNVGGISEVVNQENGILISPSDEKNCTLAILDISRNQHRFNQQLIAQKAADTFSYNTIGRQLAGVYNQLLDN